MQRIWSALNQCTFFSPGVRWWTNEKLINRMTGEPFAWR
jgi:hypothetical protein